MTPCAPAAMPARASDGTQSRFLAGVNHLDADRHAKIVAGLAHPLQRFQPEPLKGVRRSPRLKDPAAEDVGAARVDLAGDPLEHLVVLDGARPGDARRVDAAD